MFLTPLEVFYSFADADEPLRNKLEEHLSLLHHEGFITIWHKHQISAGMDWTEATELHLNTASVILLLISPSFLASDYCYRIEMQRALQRHNNHEACIIPILLRPVDWQNTPLGKLKALPSNGKPITQWRNRDRALTNVAIGVRQAIENLTLRSQSASPDVFSGIWNVPYARNLCFTGRESVLEQLHYKLTKGGTNDATSTSIAALTQPQAINGLGGIGKTQIAIEYAYRHRNLYPFTFWVNGTTEETLISSFVSIANFLPSFPEKDASDPKKVVGSVKRWLEQSDDRWLLILDNADDILLVRDFLPKNGKGNIVLTTRAYAVGSIAESIEVEKMGWLEGTHLLLRRANRFEGSSDEDVNEAGNIVIALDYLPLALDQAGAYIEETGCSLSHYLLLYQSHSKELLARRGIQSSDYPHAVATTWSLSFQKVEQANPAAAELLRLCAFLAPDAIPEEIINRGASALPPTLRRIAKEPIRLNDAIAALLSYSLIRRNPNHTLTVHRLVQAVLKHEMSKNSRRRWVERTIRAVRLVFPTVDYDNWSVCLLYLPHAQSCSMLIEEWHIATPDAAQLLKEAGEYLRQATQFELAESLLLRALTIYEQISSPNDPYTADILDRVATLYYDLGLYEKAEPLFLRALTIREQMLGPMHHDTATTVDNLALLYQYQGFYEKAEPLFLRGLMIREQVLGPDHLDTASSLNDLAQLYYEQGFYEKAEPLYQRGLAIREQILGPDHPDTASSLNDLALVYSDQGFYEKAEPLFLRGLTISERVFGPDHPETATSLCNLALLYKDQGLYEKAEPLFLRDLSISERVLGPNHRDTATSLYSLALLYKDQGLYEKAEPLFLRALAIRENVLGSDHLDTADALKDLASLYCDLLLYEKAEPLFLRSLSIHEQLLGSDHPWTITIYDNLAALYHNQGLHEKAKLFIKKRNKKHNKNGPRHPPA